MKETKHISKPQQFKKQAFYQSSSSIILFTLSYLLIVVA